MTDHEAAPARQTPLEGLLVLDVSQGIAGPSCGGMFAEYGARVIKVEPPQGDWMRHLGPGAEEVSVGALVYNRGKQSLAVDLKADEGRAAVLKLAERADVFIESGRPGTTERLGLGYDVLRAANAQIIYVSVSGYGQTGPNRDLPLTDTVAQSQSGLMAINLGREGVPQKIDMTLVDVVAGLHGFQAATMALWGRRSTGEGCHVDVNLTQSAAALQAPKIAEYGLVGHMPKKLNAPAGSYPTKDGWIAITLVKEESFPRICRALGLDELPDDPRFASFEARAAHLDALTALFDARLRERTTADWLAQLETEGAMAGPINDYGAWLADTHVQAIEAAPPVPLAADQTVPIPRMPGQGAFDAPAPRIGAHSRKLLREAGLDQAAIDDLITRGIVRHIIDV